MKKERQKFVFIKGGSSFVIQLQHEKNVLHLRQLLFLLPRTGKGIVVVHIKTIMKS